MNNSKFLSLNYNDFLKGLLMAILTPVMVLLVKYFDNGEFDIDWILIARSAVGGLLAYLMKNFFTNSAGKVATSEIWGDRPNDR